MASYIVTSPLVIVRNTQQGDRQEYLYEGSELPDFVSAEERKRLVDDGHVAKVESEAPTPATNPDERDAATGQAKDTSPTAKPAKSSTSSSSPS